MKFYITIFIIAFLFFGHKVDARHITGGEMMYEFVSYDAASNTYKYRLKLRLFRDAQNCTAATSCADLPPSLTIGIYNNNNNSRVGGYRIMQQSNFVSSVPIVYSPPCLTNTPVFKYEMAEYELVVDLPANTLGYTVAYQTCCRVNDIGNIGNADDAGSTYSTIIPGTNTLPTRNFDNSPKFEPGISIICYNKPFQLNFSATDQDADSLVYAMANAYNGGGAFNASWATPAGPPYGPVGYVGNFSGANPFGTNTTINPHAGIISGIAPTSGKYIVCVEVKSYKNGNLISTNRKDFIITVAPCDFADASLTPTYTTCDGFDLSFQNTSTSAANLTFRWDFGDGSFSTNENPTHVYTTAGDYNVKLVVNPGTPCADSATTIARVYPGFFPGINAPDFVCVNTPVQFDDATTLNYGFVNSWKWDFGFAGTTADTSIIKNPTYTFTQPGTYTVSLNVKSSKGCDKTITKKIIVSNNVDLAVTKDTIMCINEQMQLNAEAGIAGTYTWSPNQQINNINAQNPIVTPTTTTRYYVDFLGNTGCVGKDSVLVKVVTHVSLTTMADTTICRSDNVQLNINTDGVKWEWTPDATLNDASVEDPIATPTDPLTTYTVKAIVGNCFSTATIRVGTVPYPVANAGEDKKICLGESTGLTATGGSVYEWWPTIYLASPHNATTAVTNPQQTINYIVKVTDVLGCPKPVYDTVKVTVINLQANAGPRDTSVVVGQPLQLNGTSNTPDNAYTWSPDRFLSDANIPNPIAFPQENITYVLNVRSDNGCFNTDTISVKVYNLEAGIYVPSAFTPGANGNGDGLNDVFRPIPLGIRTLDYFRVYNRWGELVYSTSQIGAGWDGRHKGIPQGAGTYVWEASAMDYANRKISKKGSVILIR